VETSSRTPLVIWGRPKKGDTLTADGPNSAYWGLQAGTYAVPRSPADFSAQGLDLWLKAESIGIADGAVVGNWPDSSDYGGVVTWVAKNPVYRVTGGPNGGPSVDALPDGGAWQKVGNAPITGDITCFVVFKHQLPALTQVIFGAHIAGDVELYIANSHIHFTASVGTWEGATIGTAPSGVWSLLLVTFRASDSTLVIDLNGNVETFNIGGATVFVDDGVMNVGSDLGRAGATGNFFQGQFAELGYFRTVLTVDQLASLKAYLYNRYFG